MGRRVENWPSILAGLIQEYRRTPFQWGAFDCCIWPAIVKDAITGSNLVEQMASLYSDKTSALKLIADAGGFEQLITAHLGDPVNRKMIGRADIALIQHDEDQSLAIFDGHMCIATGPNGLRMLPPDSIIKGWKV